MNYFTVKDNQLVPATSDIGSKLLTPKSDPVIAVQKPCRRTVFILDMNNSNVYNMPFPYVVFVCTAQQPTHLINRSIPSLKAVLCLEPPTLESDVYLIPMGNIYICSSINSIICADAGVCLSNMMPDDLNVTPNNLIDYFWNSEFYVNWPTCANKIMKDGYKGWSRIPMEDVLNPKHWTRHANIFTIADNLLHNLHDLIAVANLKDAF